MNRTVAIIAVIAIAAASCTEGETTTTDTSTNPTTTTIATVETVADTTTTPPSALDLIEARLRAMTESTTTTADVLVVRETTGVDIESGVSWVEYDACVQAHWHEEGVDPPPGTFINSAFAAITDDQAAALALFREKCAPWRPVRYEKSPFTGSRLPDISEKPTAPGG